MKSGIHTFAKCKISDSLCLAYSLPPQLKLCSLLSATTEFTNCSTPKTKVHRMCFDCFGPKPNVRRKCPFVHIRRREPQRGPRNHYRGALSPPHSVGAEIETPKASRASRGRKHGKGCPLTIRLRVWESVVSSPNGVWGRARPKMDLMHISGQKKPSKTPFSVFSSDGGPPKRRGARENSPLSTGLPL